MSTLAMWTIWRFLETSETFIHVSSWTHRWCIPPLACIFSCGNVGPLPVNKQVLLRFPIFQPPHNFRWLTELSEVIWLSSLDVSGVQCDNWLLIVWSSCKHGFLLQAGQFLNNTWMDKNTCKCPSVPKKVTTHMLASLKIYMLIQADALVNIVFFWLTVYSITLYAICYISNTTGYAVCLISILSRVFCHVFVNFFGLK